MTVPTQKRQLWVILTVVFLGFVGISIPYLIFPPLFLNSNYSFLPSDASLASRGLYLGVVLAAYPLGQFVGAPILGALSDTYGRKSLITASLVVSGLCNLVSGFAITEGSLWLLTASRLIAGLMEGNIAIARAMATDLKLISKHNSFGKINAVTSIAYLVGPAIGGLLTDKSISEALQISTPFYFICFFFFCLAGLSALVLKNTLITPPTHKPTILQHLNFIKRMSVLFANKQLKYLLIASTVFTIAVDIFYEFGPVYLTVKWMLGPAQLIYYGAALCLALAVGNGWLPNYIMKHGSSRWPILVSLGGFALILLGIITTNSVALMLILFGLSGLFIGLGVTLITVNISDSVSDAIQGEVMGTQMSLRVFGDGIICLFGGALLILSSKLILIIAAIMSAGAMFYYKIRHCTSKN